MPASTSSSSRHGRKDFSAGSAVARTLSSWGATLPKLLLLAIVVNVPMLLWRWFTRDDAEAPGWSAIDLVQRLFDVVLSGLCIHVVFKRLVNEPAPIGDSFAIGMRRIVPLLLNGVLVTLMLFVPMVLVGLLLGVSPGLGAIIGLPILILVTYVMTITIASPGAVMVEGMGAIAAMKRSIALTKGSRWSIYWGFFLVGIVNGVLGAVGAFAGAAFEQSTLFLVLAGVGLVTTTISATYSAVAYHDLRTAKEGVDVKELMRVFA